MELEMERNKIQQDFLLLCFSKHTRGWPLFNLEKSMIKNFSRKLSV